MKVLVGGDKKLLFDTNVWIFIFAPISDYDKDNSNKFAKFFSLCVEKRARIYVSSHILSEFINRFLKLAFEQYKAKESRDDMGWKEFRKTGDYRENLRVLQGILRRILDKAECLNDNFSEFARWIKDEGNISELEKADFTDVYMVWLARKNGMKIVSQDGDMKRIYQGGVIDKTMI